MGAEEGRGGSDVKKVMVKVFGMHAVKYTSITPKRGKQSVIGKLYAHLLDAFGQEESAVSPHT